MNVLYTFGGLTIEDGEYAVTDTIERYDLGSLRN
jgi:hypothetical protein